MNEKKVRKYYRVLVRRIPPYAFVNGTYDYWEDVYAYSEEGAINCIARRYRKVYGHNIPLKAYEISKEEFKGHHKTSVRGEFDYGKADESDN